MADSAVELLGALKGEGAGRIKLPAEQLRRVMLMAFTGSTQLSKAALNDRADRLKQQRRTTKRVHSQSLACWESGKLWDIQQHITAPRRDKRADAPIIREGWHEWCRIKKGMGQTKKFWLPKEEREDGVKYLEHEARLQTETDHPQARPFAP